MDNIIDKIVKRFDSEDTVKFSEKSIYDKDGFWVFTGSPVMEYNLGILGYPAGIVELSGMSKSGKTTLALAAMRAFQKHNPEGICVILSSENRDNKLYAEAMGIDTTKVIIIKTRFVETMFFKLQGLLKEVNSLWSEEKLPGKPKVFVMWDSLGATLSVAEKKAFDKNAALMESGEVEDDSKKLKNAQLGAFSKNAKMGAKMILAQLFEMDISFIILNHRYDNIGVVPGTTSTGGHWIEFLPSLRLELKFHQWVKVGDEEVGQITKVKVDKNDYGSRRPTYIEILLGKGLVLTEEDIEYAVEKGILKKEGKTGVSFMGDKLKWTTKRTFYQHYLDNNKLLPILTNKILKERHNDTMLEKGLI